jgi:hypothetical protein
MKQPNMSPTFIAAGKAYEERSRPVGRPAALVGFPGGHWLVLPQERALLKFPLWQVVKEREPVHTWRTPEVALMPFAGGVMDRTAIAFQRPAVDVQGEFFGHLVADPAPAAVLTVDFAAGVGSNWLGRAARRLGAWQCRTGFSGTWTWEMSSLDGIEVGGATADETVDALFVNQDHEDSHEQHQRRS